MRISTTIRTTMPDAGAAPSRPIASITAETMPTPTTSTRITPNTCQPLPRTSSRLRPQRAQAAGRSSTTTGAATDQIVIRISPGMTIRMKPITMPMPATMPTRMSLPSTGVAAEQLPDAGVAAAVLDVGHQLDDHAR